MQFIVNKFPHISLDKLIDNKNEPFIQMLVHVDPSDLCLPIGDNIDHSLDVYFEDYENTSETGHDKSFESARPFETKSQNRDIFSKRASMSARNLSNINKFLIRESNVSDQVVESNTQFLSNRSRSLSAKELRTEIQVTLQRLARMEVKSLQENSNHRRINSEDRVMSARRAKSINKRRIKSKTMKKTRRLYHRKVIKKEELPNNLLQTDARMNAFSSELHSPNSSTSVNSYVGDRNRSRSINESPSFDLLKSTSNNNAPLCSPKQNVFKYWLNLHKQLNYVPTKFLNPRTNKHRGSSSLKLRKRRFSVNFNKRLGNFSATTLKRRNLKKSHFSASKQHWVEKGVKPRGEITATVSTQTINDDVLSVIQYQTQPAMLRGPESDEVDRNNEESIAQEGNNDDEFELNLLDELTISTEEKQIGSTNDDSQQLETTTEVSNQQVVINSPEGQIFTEQNPLNIEADENIMLTGLTRPSFTRTM